MPLILLALALPNWPRPAFAQIDRRVPRSDAPKRVALVIGNDAYSGMPLKNGVNDAETVTRVPEGLGFAVDMRSNLTRLGLEQVIRIFVGRLSPGDIGFFFYAGHGIQVEGENYLVPTDFDAQNAIEAKYKAYAADLVRDLMERSGSRLNVIVLDACRDNPFKFSRSGSRGLGAMQTARGTLIALATSPGKTASDNPSARNGLFTLHLVDALKTPGLKIQDVFERTKAAVDEASGHQQTPWVLSSVIGEYYLQAPSAGTIPPVQAAAGGGQTRTADRSDLSLQAEIEFWKSAEVTNTADAYQAYLVRYPSGTYVLLATAKLKDRYQMAANEMAAIGDIRTIITYESSYISVNGWAAYGDIECLASPADCIQGYASGPLINDTALAVPVATRHGYVFRFTPGKAIAPSPGIGKRSIESYLYTATPVAAGKIGVRGFAGDSSGRICFTRDGSAPRMVGAPCDPVP